MRSHEIVYKIHGDDMQFVEIELDPGETVIAEAGAMMYMGDQITFETKMGDGSDSGTGAIDKIWNAGRRMLSRESVFMTHFSNSVGKKKGHVAFAAPYSGKIIPVNLAKLRGKVTCQKDAFLCAAPRTKISIEYARKLGVGFFGSEGFILQTLEGDGKAFIHACGGVALKKLKDSKIIVDPGCLIAFAGDIEYDIQRAGSLKSMIFGGEGLFLATLSGTGYVWIQSLPFSRLADKLALSASSAGGDTRGATHAIVDILND